MNNYVGSKKSAVFPLFWCSRLCYTYYITHLFTRYTSSIKGQLQLRKYEYKGSKVIFAVHVEESVRRNLTRSFVTFDRLDDTSRFKFCIPHDFDEKRLCICGWKKTFNVAETECWWDSFTVLHIHTFIHTRNVDAFSKNACFNGFLYNGIWIF